MTLGVKVCHDLIINLVRTTQSPVSVDSKKINQLDLTLNFLIVCLPRRYLQLGFTNNWSKQAFDQQRQQREKDLNIEISWLAVKFRISNCEEPETFYHLFKLPSRTILPHLVENMFSVLQSFLGQVSLSLDLDVETGGDIRDQKVDQFADTKHHVLEDNHKGKLESENLPVDRGEHTKLVSKSSVVAFRLEL